MDDALERADWNGFPQRRTRSQQTGKYAVSVSQPSSKRRWRRRTKGPGGGGFDENGEMTLIAVTQSSGQGHETVFPQIVAETLGIDVAHVRFSRVRRLPISWATAPAVRVASSAPAARFKLLGQK